MNLLISSNSFLWILSISYMQNHVTHTLIVLLHPFCDIIKNIFRLCPSSWQSALKTFRISGVTRSLLYANEMTSC